MNDRLRILEMVKAGKVSPEEAARLLDELDRAPRPTARTLRVRIRRPDGQHVNFAVPVSVAGTIVSLIPEQTRARLERQGTNLAELLRAIQEGEAVGELVNIREPGGTHIAVTVE